jgi:primosomal protein N' (replication factor Y)
MSDPLAVSEPGITAPPLYADVVVPRHLRRAFTYKIPFHLQGLLRIGHHVQVPFGRSRLHGLVTALSVSPPVELQNRAGGHQLRELTTILDPTDPDVTPELLELSRIVSERYLAPWGQCLRLILPPSRGKVSARRPALTQAVKAPTAAKGPRAGPGSHRTSPWWDRLRTALEDRRHETLLMQGSSASRLKAIIQACDEALTRQRSAIVIAPEIARASSIAGLAAARWGDRVALFHSGLSLSLRHEIWNHIRRGQIDLVVGTRSAIFAPLSQMRTGGRDLGLLCVDAEEDPALKDEQEPRYHARDLAWIRARRHDAVLLLASAHASMETIAALESSAVEDLRDPEAPAQAAVQIVDLREQYSETMLSTPLIEALRHSLDARTGAILYLNRKGFASALFCRDCGAVPQCQRCSVTLRYYRAGVRQNSDHSSSAGSSLRCLYCGTREAVPEICPACRSARLQPVGFGTARLEEEIRRLFPQARIGRLDADRTAQEAQQIWKAATVGSFDVLIGTQMLFQGPSLPPVGLVGIPHADAGLHVPDFRSAERTYHALQDAVVLARPPVEGGTVILQTFLPRHHAIAALASGTPALFYDEELAVRKATGYPPFASLISLRVSGLQSGLVQQAATRWAKSLHVHAKKLGHLQTDDLVVLGPVPASLSRIRGRYRWQLLVKSRDADIARQSVRATVIEIEETSPRGLKFEIDVDPLELV